MSNTFSFKTQLSFGDKGERDFQEHYAHLGPVKSEDRRIDFTLKDGKTVELKTDSYGMDKTDNFFFEVLSSTDSGKLGGVYRAYEDGIDYFVYYYSADRTFFWFDVKKLYAEVKKLIESGEYKIKNIKNRNWITQGFALPREKFEHIHHLVDVLDK